jgi:acetolactate synthase-1/2/3 large subunit
MARRPVFYTGGGVINSGLKASEALRKLQAETGIPVTSTLMGLGAFPASHKDWLGMVGMHGSYEANNAMHDCDLMICVGARFDDRVTGRIDAFSPNSKKVHIDIDPSSINKIVRVDVPIVADCAAALEALITAVKHRKGKKPDLKPWKAEIDAWRARDCFAYEPSDKVIKPQYAIERLYALTRERDTLHHDRGRPAPDVGGPVLPFRRAEPLDDLRRPRHDGLWPARRCRRTGAHPDALVIDIAGEASDPDDDAGIVHRRSVLPAGEGFHPQQ